MCAVGRCWAREFVARTHRAVSSDIDARRATRAQCFEELPFRRRRGRRGRLAAPRARRVDVTVLVVFLGLVVLLGLSRTPPTPPTSLVSIRSRRKISSNGSSSRATSTRRWWRCAHERPRRESARDARRGTRMSSFSKRSIGSRGDDARGMARRFTRERRRARARSKIWDLRTCGCPRRAPPSIDKGTCRRGGTI